MYLLRVTFDTVREVIYKVVAFNFQFLDVSFRDGRKPERDPRNTKRD